MYGQELYPASPVLRSQVLATSDNIRREQEDDWILRESETRCIEPFGGLTPASLVTPRSTTIPTSPLPVLDSSRPSALDVIPERRMSFEDERMMEERARPGAVRESLGTEDEITPIESSFMQPIGRPDGTPASVNVTSQAAIISSDTTGVLVYGGCPAAPSRPGVGSVSVCSGMVGTGAGGGGGRSDSSSHSSRGSHRRPPGGGAGRGPPRGGGGGGPPQRGNSNSNGDNGNGDENCDEGDQNHISSHRGPPGPPGAQGPLGPQGIQGPQGV